MTETNNTEIFPVTAQARADVLFIGYPKAASTFVTRFLANHPEVTVDEHRLSELLRPGSDAITVVNKPSPDKVHVSRDESVAESVCWIRGMENWRRNLYVPGAWNRVKDDIVVDPAETALRLHNTHPGAKVLLLIREQVDWLQSVYKYVMYELPWRQRSFTDYCGTPSGIVMLRAGHFDQTIPAYIDVFGSDRVHIMRFEDIVEAPKRFAAELCAFIGISERPIPQRRDNESHALIAKIQRYFPIIEALPRSLKRAMYPHAMRFLPGARGTILSSHDIRMLRGMYAASNQRTEKLINPLSARTH